MNSYSEDLIREFSDKEYRDAYAQDFLNTKIATQLRVIRELRQLSQDGLAKRVGIEEQCVDSLEDVNHTGWNITILANIASALDVRLNVSFETFGSLLDEDDSFSRRWLERPDFEHDPAFHVSAASAAVDLSVSQGLQKALAGEDRLNTSVVEMASWRATHKIGEKLRDTQAVEPNFGSAGRLVAGRRRA